jgi:hypothetical protein
MAGRGDEMAARAGDGGRLRASHADREQVIGTLKAAFVQGLLDKDEFDLRVGQAFASRTYAELAAVTADIPAGPNSAQPPEPARAQARSPVLRPGRVIIAASLLYAGAWGIVFLSPRHGDNFGALVLIQLTTLAYFLVLILAGGHIVASRDKKRSGGQSPRRPASGAGGQASQRLPSAGPAGRLPPVGHGQSHVKNGLC